MSNPSFSVIVPVYGVEMYIRTFAETLLNQTYENLQFIFVNDGTKDSSIEILNALISERYSHLREKIMIVNKENGGLPSARKAGMEYATGDYILHVDSDDWLELSLFERLARKAEETDSDIIYFDFYKEYAKRSKLDVEREYDVRSKMSFIRGLFNHKAYGYVWNKCVKRKLYQDNVIFFPTYGMHEDIYLMSQLIYYAGSIVHLDEPLYHYRRNNPLSISSACRIKRRGDSSRNMLDLYSKFKGDLKNSLIRDVYGEILFRSAWYSMLYGLGYFEEFPFLAKDILSLKMSFSYRTLIIKQLIVKIYVWLKY